MSRVILVAAIGATAFARMPYLAPAIAKVLTKPTKPNFAAAQLACPRLPKTPGRRAGHYDPSVPRVRRCGHAALMTLKAPSTWTLCTASHVSNDIFAKLESRRIPALATTPSIRPKVSKAVATYARAALGGGDVLYVGHGTVASGEDLLNDNRRARRRGRSAVARNTEVVEDYVGTLGGEEQRVLTSKVPHLHQSPRWFARRKPSRGDLRQGAPREHHDEVSRS